MSFYGVALPFGGQQSGGTVVEGAVDVGSRGPFDGINRYLDHSNYSS